MLYTYDIKKFTFTWGIIILDDFFEGGEVTIERNSDLWVLSKNVTGGGTRAKQNDSSGRIIFSLDQASPVNNEMSAYIALDKISNAGVAPFLARDLNGTTAVFAENCWAVKDPIVTLGNNSSGREWILETENLEIFVGGSN